MRNAFTLYEHTDFGGKELTLRLDDHPIDALHSLKGTALHDEVSSLVWDLPRDVVVVLYEHDDGTGRAYEFGLGTGEDRSTHDEDFKDCATAWRWTRPTEQRSVLEAFGRIRTDGRVAAFDRANARLRGGHLQGLGCIDRRTLAISANSDDGAVFFVVQWRTRVGRGLGRVIERVDVADPPLSHAGGLQIVDDVLALGVEDDAARDRSRIECYDVRRPRAINRLAHLSFDRPGPGQRPQTRRWTAGAVGLARTTAGYLLVVGSWESEHLDFYRSTGADLRRPTCRFVHIADWRKDEADRDTWIDDSWAAYQSLNLVVGPGGRLFLVGGHDDWIDLYELHLDAERRRRIVKIGKRRLNLHDGADFEYAGGIVIDGSTLHAIATEEHLNERTTINLFEGPGGIDVAI
jgi:hypothetical protein